MTIAGKLDARFSEATEAVAWPTVDAALAGAELYWLTTVRAGGRPHVTPLVGLWTGAEFVFCTGPGEQKARNLAHSPAVCVTTGANAWSDGLDVVVEGVADRVTGLGALTPLADAYREKYGADWDFTSTDDGFGEGEELAHVFRVPAAKVIAFDKSPHGQTTFHPAPQK